MRRSFTIIFSLTFIVLMALMGTLTVSAVSEDHFLAVQDAPDLAGKNVYFSEGFGESSQFDRSDKGVSRYASLLHSMGANLFVLDWRQNIPDNADLVVIPGPTKDFSADAIARLWVYIQKGGHLLLFVDALDDKGNPSQALKSEKGLFSVMWGDFGIRARDDVMVKEGDLRTVHVGLVDASGAAAGEKDIQAAELSLNFQASLANDQNPITQGLIGSSTSTSDLTAPVFSIWGARSVDIDTSFQNNVITPLIIVDQPTIYGETNYADYVANGGAAEYNIGVDTPRGPLFVAAAVENQTFGAKIVLVGDADFVKNGAGLATSPNYSGAFIYPVQANFMVQASAWLLEAKGSNFVFPTPAATSTATTTPTQGAAVSPTVVVSITASATSTPSATPTLVPSPTSTPSPTVTASATRKATSTVAATATIKVSVTVETSATVKASETAVKATSTVAATATVKASSTPAPTATVAASATPAASATGVVSSTPVASVTPTATATP